jgi:hypothetical protein
MHRLRTAVACAGAALMLSACSAGVSTTAPADRAKDDPTTLTKPQRTVAPPPAPKAGECRELSYPDISLYSNETATRPCSKPHTAYTFDVEQLPDDIAFEGVHIENDAVQSAAAAACQQSFASFIGGDTADRALTRLTVTYFVPKQTGFDAGAHWVRCDIIALQSATSLAPLPRHLEGFLEAHGASEYDVCSLGDPSTNSSTLVICTRGHTYRAVAALSLGGVKAPYPGEQSALSDGKKRCADTIADLLGASGGFTYSWTYPSASDWSAGQRFGYCWNQTSS